MAMPLLRKMLLGLESLNFLEKKMRRRDFPTKRAKICNYKNYERMEFVLTPKN